MDANEAIKQGVFPGNGQKRRRKREKGWEIPLLFYGIPRIFKKIVK
jgi:hypothetical protein